MAKGPIPKIPSPVHISRFMEHDLMKTGVYFLYRQDKLVYVGQTRTLKWRLDNHLAQGVKDFDSIAFIPCTTDRLMEIEGYYIKRHAPEYNQCGIAKSSRERHAWQPRMEDGAPVQFIDADDVEMNMVEAAVFLRVDMGDMKIWKQSGVLADYKLMTLLHFAMRHQSRIVASQLKHGIAA